MLTVIAKLNKKTAAAKLGPKLKEAEVTLEKFDTEKFIEELRAGSFTLVGVGSARQVVPQNLADGEQLAKLA